LSGKLVGRLKEHWLIEFLKNGRQLRNVPRIKKEGHGI